LVARLTRRAIRGEERAFEEIFRTYHQDIYRYCLAILHNTSDAEDAMQATMAAALRALPGEEREIALKPWLYRVAHNEAISLLRGRQEPVPTEDLPEPSGDVVATDAEQRERMRVLVADLNALPERQRAALVMRELSGLEYEEIGASLGCSEAAARQTVYEARLSLRTRSEGREMSCEETRRAVSDGDRRRLRGRKLKAHLASCEPCRDFQAAIEIRRDDFQALCPALPAAAASGILAGLIGTASAKAAGAGAAGSAAGVAAAGAGSSAGAGLAGAGGVASGLATAGAVKGAAIAAAVVIAAGAGEVAGVVDLPGPVDVGREAGQASDPASPNADPGEVTGAASRPGSARALEARTQGEEASAAKGDNRAERAVEANGEHQKGDHKGKSGQAKGKGNGSRPSQPGSNGPGQQGGPPQGVGGGQPGVQPPVTPAPQAPSDAGGGGGGSPESAAPPAVQDPGPPPSAGEPRSSPAPAQRLSPPGGGPPS
jgi:RNA polymerase sigma factor (sigma-70 family)